MQTLFACLVVANVLLLLTKEASAIVWGITLFVYATLSIEYSLLSNLSNMILSALTFISVLFSIKPFREKFISSYIYKIAAKSVPIMSKTEREALEAGTVGFESELFSGKPNFHRMLNQPAVVLTEDEQAFYDGPLNELCAMIDDWQITHEKMDMPPQMWEFIKNNRFLGMIIPKSFGGLEFSATMQMMVLSRLYGRSVTVATTVAVPNSLGPGELLLKYGTQHQKDYYLPRLASGQEIPCFALTGPNAGSDAASIPDMGIVCYDEFDGKKTLGIRLNWDKRYITLCPVATIIGLAFRLFDPDNHLGKGRDVGITCALIPADTKGVVKGRRHFPMNTAFMNGPTQGTDVFIPMDYIIGGEAEAGNGWRMLMECLSVGRAISLPSSASGGIQTVALASTAYAFVRQQFGVSIGKFEGIEEALGRIIANTYMIDAALTMGVAAIDSGEKPAIVGAILKYHSTERARTSSMDGMDIHGGKGICLGPNNYIGRGYQSAPIGITVEGANILTRNLIIFGQGAIRCHPYAYSEVEAVRKHDIKAFDKALWGHASYFVSNLVKSILFNITKGKSLFAKPLIKKQQYIEKTKLLSTNFAFLSDFCMLTLGGELKRKERLSARLGDVLSKLYLISASIRRFKHEGQEDSDLAVLDLTCQTLFFEIEDAMAEIIANYPNLLLRMFLKRIIQPFGYRFKKPNDKLVHQVVEHYLLPSNSRDRLTRLAYKIPGLNCPVGRLELAFSKAHQVQEMEKKLSRAVKEGSLQSLTRLEQIEEALASGIIDESEATVLREAEALRQEIIAVDDFDLLMKTAAVRTTKSKKTKSLETI